MLYGAHEIRLINSFLNSLFIWSFVTCKDTVVLYLFWTPNFVLYPFSQVFLSFQEWVHHIERMEKWRVTNWRQVWEEIWGFIVKGNRSREKWIQYGDTWWTICWSIYDWKEVCYQDEVLEEKVREKHDSNSDADEDWLTFMNSRGWTEDQIKRGV